QSLLKDLMHKTFGGDDDLDFHQRHISHWKNAQISPQQALTEVVGSDAVVKLTATARLYEVYDRHMKAYNAVDFDDLIRIPVELLQNDAAVREKWQNRIRYLLVDEYQDTNTSQYLLVKLLVGARGALTVVGDDDQSIYAWRGAQPENLALLQKDFFDLKVIKLEQNYRSTGCILKAANHLIANNPHVFEKSLWSELGFGETIRVIKARNEEHEAQRVVSRILQHKFQSRKAFKDYAILYRGNHQSRLLERHLREHQMPYTLTGGTSFFSYAEVKDVLSYIRLVVNNDDDHAFVRVANVPRREVGPGTLEKLATYATQRGISMFDASYELGLEQHMAQRSVSKLRAFTDWIGGFSHRAERGEVRTLVRDLVQEMDFETWLLDSSRDQAAADRKMENVAELLQWVDKLMSGPDAEDLGKVVSQLQLMDILERQENEQERDCINLMTLHAAKGLEFPYVYIIGMEEELLPHHSSIDEGNVEEERRLAYVGITRAQRELTFSYAEKRKRAGEMVSSEPSRFLNELPQDTVQWESGNEDPEQRQQRGQAHLSNLRDILGSL
ncbi:MAG: UvrD-helicase domain-containing protein, partial [Gammaproteobacteria bacterium]|nr:UvrD-helicase domain-containing protein [Gammaproteobacteria bacterium]